VAELLNICDLFVHRGSKLPFSAFFAHCVLTVDPSGGMLHNINMIYGINRWKVHFSGLQFCCWQYRSI